MVQDGTDGGRVDGSLGLILFEQLQIRGVEQLGRVIFGSGDEHGVVARHLHVVDGRRVLLDAAHHLARAQVPLGDLAVLVSGDEDFVERAPQQGRDLRVGYLPPDDGRLRLERLVDVPGVDDEHFALLPHGFVRGIGRLVGAVAESRRPDGRAGLDVAHFAPRAQVPQSARAVSAAGYGQGRVPVDVDAPHHAVVAVERSQPLSVQRPPYVRSRIFTGGDQQVAFSVVFDLGDGPFVPLQQQRLHLAGHEGDERC